MGALKSKNQGRTGPSYTSYTNGRLWSSANYKDGEYDGLQQSWYRNDQLEYRYNYKNGKHDGLQEVWGENGQLIFKYNYDNGKREGIQEAWFAKGQLRCKSYYCNSKETGIRETYTEFGALTQTYHINGKEVTKREYDVYLVKLERVIYSVMNINEKGIITIIMHLLT